MPKEILGGDSSGQAMGTLKPETPIHEQTTNGKRFREIVEKFPDVLFAMDKDLRYTFWNQASEKLTGIKAEDAVGKTIWEVFPDNKARQEVTTRYLQVIETQQPQSWIEDYPGDQTIVHEISAYPTTEGACVFAKDVTERKKKEERIRNKIKIFHSLIEYASDGILIADPQGKFIEVNSKGCNMLGYTEEEITNLSIETITHLGSNDLSLQLGFEKLAKEKELIVKTMLTRKDGSLLPVKINFKILPNGKMLGLVHNLTEYEQTEDKVEKVNGIIPICANCKNVRNHEGSWQRIETYIKEHEIPKNSEFSHGICTDCMIKLYPEYPEE